MKSIVCHFALLLITTNLFAQDGHGHEHFPKSWDFWPNYVLPGSAENYVGPRSPIVSSPVNLFAKRPSSMTYQGEEATDFVTNLITSPYLPTEEFTIEILTVDHVNRPIGAFVGVTQGVESEVQWVLGFYDNDVYFGEVTNNESTTIATNKRYRVQGQDIEGLESFKRYWNHLVGVYSKGMFSLYNNGQLVATEETDLLEFSLGEDARLEVSAFLDNEPYMDLGNAVRLVNIYDEAISESDIKDAYQLQLELLEEGQIFHDFFHYTAGPYLNTVFEDGINILWETDRPASGKVLWGTELPYTDSLIIEEASRLHKVTLENLNTDFPYFYNIQSTSEQGEVIETGNLTFKTAPKAGQPISFAVVGDTEARPFVNDRIAKLIWEERVDFLMLVGDLTDGGQSNLRWQWTHEYFLGMNQLSSRVPVLPAPGNGEGDRVWYDYYHHLPDDSKPYYSYRHGDAEFFMLDTNMGHREREDSEFRKKQREWLDEALASSDAKWKFAGHHHPTYSSDENDYGDTMKEQSENGDMEVRNDFVDVYEKHNVDVVFFGHLHSYERTHGIKNESVNNQEGVVYVQTGGGGGNHEKASPTRNWFTRKVFSDYHYTLVNIEDNMLTITVIDAEGRMRDQFVIEK
jgi:hypothetical protein